MNKSPFPGMDPYLEDEMWVEFHQSRFTRRPHTEVWPIQLRDKLPTVPVPLLPPDPDVPLALQPALEACFELVGYQRLLDYDQPPPSPSLSQEDSEWVEAMVQAHSQETNQ